MDLLADVKETLSEIQDIIDFLIVDGDKILKNNLKIGRVRGRGNNSTTSAETKFV